jgi:hypothetical protein
MPAAADHKHPLAPDTLNMREHPESGTPQGAAPKAIAELDAIKRYLSAGYIQVA